mmetsp:Transcript_94096/g.263387  ORF Transcript_94096/g.263387 Transcript_94096/m.263387 type:complete len:270 (+) Transcript_94096:604-1413(+)
MSRISSYMSASRHFSYSSACTTSNTPSSTTCSAKTLWDKKFLSTVSARRTTFSEVLTLMMSRIFMITSASLKKIAPSGSNDNIHNAKMQRYKYWLDAPPKSIETTRSATPGMVQIWARNLAVFSRFTIASSMPRSLQTFGACTAATTAATSCSAKNLGHWPMTEVRTQAALSALNDTARGDFKTDMRGFMTSTCSFSAVSKAPKDDASSRSMSYKITSTHWTTFSSCADSASRAALRIFVSPCIIVFFFTAGDSASSSLSREADAFVSG